MHRFSINYAATLDRYRITHFIDLSAGVSISMRPGLPGGGNHETVNGLDAELNNMLAVVIIFSAVILTVIRNLPGDV
jgi:hypothetical protein